MRADPTHHSQDCGKPVMPSDFRAHKELFHGLDPMMCLLISRFTSAVRSRDVVLLGCHSPINIRISLGIALLQLEQLGRSISPPDAGTVARLHPTTIVALTAEHHLPWAGHIRRPLHSSGTVGGDIASLNVCSCRRIAHYCRRS